VIGELHDVTEAVGVAVHQAGVVGPFQFLARHLRHGSSEGQFGKNNRRHAAGSPSAPANGGSLDKLVQAPCAPFAK
jgi:hypothetical protein